MIPQAVGVVGFIVHRNSDNLSFSGLSAAFAAGNRAMVKMSENSIHLTQFLQDFNAKIF